jgi:hypothetical protein
MTAAVSRVLRWGFNLGASAVLLYFGLSLCARGISLSDEGYLLSQAVDMLAGKVLYRDMDAFVTPGVWFVLAGLFRIADPSVFATRFVALAAWVGMAVLTFRIVRHLSPWIWAWGAVGLYAVLSVWAFPAWTIVFYSSFSILFVLAATDLLLCWRRSRRPVLLALCGVAVGLAVAFKQNYGAFALAGCAFGVLAIRLEASERSDGLMRVVFGDGLRLAVGVAAAVAPFLVYFGLHGALDEMFELLVVHPFSSFAGRQDIAFPALSQLWAGRPLEGVESMTYGSYWLAQAPHPFDSAALSWLHEASVLRRAHVLLFWLPALGLLTGLWVALRPQPERRPIDGGLAALLAIAAFVFLGVFPRADFNHLINVYEPTLIAGTVLVHRLVERLPGRRPGVLHLGLAFGAAFLVLITAVGATWFVHGYRNLNKRLTIPRAGLLVSAFQRDIVEFHVEAIQERTSEGDALLTVPALTMLNFLSERPMPGRYYNLYEHHIVRDGGAAVVEAAEASDVRLVVADYNNFFSDRVGLRLYAPALASYLRTHFEPEFDVANNRYQYLRRRDEPLREGQRVEFLADCEWDPESATYTSEHLRFASLYQGRDPLRPNATLDTTCDVRVPDHAELVFSLGQQNPWAASRDASFEAEVLVSHGGKSELLFSDSVEIRRPTGLTEPPAAVQRVDLSRFAGQDVTVVLRSRLDGWSRKNRYGLGALAMVWQDPHLEVRERRALLIGIDGATFRVIEPLLAAGRLPTLAAIAERGVSGSLGSELPPLSPRIWTTIATGKDPTRHGITAWTRATPDGGMRLLLGTDRKVPALWNIASEQGLTTGVVNWLNSYPPEIVRGVVVSDFAIAGQRQARENLFGGSAEPPGDVDATVSLPREWVAITEDLAANGAPLLPTKNPFGGNDAFPAWMDQEIARQSFIDDDLVARIALEVDARVRPDLLMVYLSGIDKVSHNLWGALEPPEIYPPHITFTDDERRATREALEDYYVYTDALLGKLVARFGANDLVMVVSDHGFEGRLLLTSVTGGHDSKAARDGVLFARGARIEAGGSALGVRIEDVTPTILAWLGLPVGADMVGRVAAFLGGPAPEVVASHDGVPVERAASAKPDVEGEILDQLRGLGYVE